MSDILGTYSVSVPNYGELFYSGKCPEYTSRPLTDEEKTNHPHAEWNPQYTSPRIGDIPVVKEVTDLFDKYGVEYSPFVDTVSGSFDLNQEWVETKPLMLDVQYSGALPIGWSDKDREYFRKLNYEGKIVTVVHWVETQEDGTVKWIPNH